MRKLTMLNALRTLVRTKKVQGRRQWKETGVPEFRGWMAGLQQNVPRVGVMTFHIRQQYDVIATLFQMTRSLPLNH